jgi:hypothetical protein
MSDLTEIVKLLDERQSKQLIGAMAEMNAAVAEISEVLEALSKTDNSEAIKALVAAIRENKPQAIAFPKQPDVYVDQAKVTVEVNPTPITVAAPVVTVVDRRNIKAWKIDHNYVYGRITSSTVTPIYEKP